MSATLEPSEVTVLDLLDRVLDRGIVLSGNLTISVAGVDLLFVDLQLVIAQCVRELESRNGAGARPPAPARPGFAISPSAKNRASVGLPPGDIP